MGGGDGGGHSIGRVAVLRASRGASSSRTVVMDSRPTSTRVRIGRSRSTCVRSYSAWVELTGVPAGFFGAAIGPDRRSPNRLIVLVWLGALSLTAGVLTLGIGLLAADRPRPPQSAFSSPGVPLKTTLFGLLPSQIACPMGAHLV